MSLDNPPRLFIPGPVHVEDDVMQAMLRPMIGHRAPEFAELMGPIHDMLKTVFRTDDPCFVVSISATGVMEGAVRNGVRPGHKVLNCVNGAFSSRWHKVSKSNGLDAVALDFDWGKAVRPEAVADALSKEKYDAVTVVHNETSTGVMSPLEEIAKVVNQHSDTLLLVDAVTSFAAVPIETKKWGVDVVLAGSQKALAIPPGLTVCAVSQAAMDRAAEVEARGTYTDFHAMLKSHAKHQTPNTPAISLLYALDARLRKITADPDRWFGEHQERADLTREWARANFGLFPEEGFESVSLTCVENTKGISIAELNSFLRERGVILSNGYGDLKEKTFRIGHMGANDLDMHRQLLSWIDEYCGVNA